MLPEFVSLKCGLVLSSHPKFLCKYSIDTICEAGSCGIICLDWIASVITTAVKGRPGGCQLSSAPSNGTERDVIHYSVLIW